MDDLSKQLRRHYDGQQLPEDRVREILALGRAVREERASRAWWRMAAAAAVLLGLGIFGASAYLRGRGELHQTTVPFVARTVVDYLSDPTHQLPVVSTDRAMLLEWLRQRGGPANFEVPPAMTALSSLGCQVLEVQGQKVYVICFFLDEPSVGLPAGVMPEKKMMVAVGPDGTMMKKSRPLVHLMVAPKAMFSAPPRPGDPAVLPLEGAWNIATWTRGDQVYTAAAVLPADKLLVLVAGT